MDTIRQAISEHDNKRRLWPFGSGFRSGTALKTLSLSLLLALLISTLSCGAGRSTLQSGPLTGNWQIALARHVLPTPQLIYTGFLIQSGNSISGNVMFNLAVGSGLCQGTGSITGTVNGQNIALSINEFGQQVSLTGTMASGNAPLAGEFSNLAGGCTNYPNSGTWIATSIAPIAGSFQGTFTSTAAPSNGAFAVTGTLNQGPNSGDSTAELSGTISATGPPAFCSYLPSATISGLISGTSVSLNLFGLDGTRIAQLGALGSNSTVTVTADGKTMSGSYLFPAVSGSSCSGDQGTFQLTFQ